MGFGAGFGWEGFVVGIYLVGEVLEVAALLFFLKASGLTAGVGSGLGILEMRLGSTIELW